MVGECVFGTGALVRARSAAFGPVDVSVSIPSGDAATITIEAQLTDNNPGTVTNTAAVAAPTDAIELTPSDNADSDTDGLGLFIDSFETLEPD